MNGSAICGFAARAAGLASVESYWHMPNVKYAHVDMTHFAFESSSRILGPSSSIKITAGEFSVNFRMRSLAMRCSK